MLKTGEQTLFCLRVWSGTGVCEWVCVCACVRLQMGSDSSQLVPKTGRDEAFHLVCEETQGCKECAEELKESESRSQRRRMSVKPLPTLRQCLSEDLNLQCGTFTSQLSPPDKYL